MTHPSAPYASLETIRAAVRDRRILSFTYRTEKILVEPHVLALSRRYFAYILGSWIIDKARFEFIRYAEIRDLEVTAGRFERVRPDYNRWDRRIGSIDTGLPQRTKQVA